MNSKLQTIIVGAGGHGHVVADALLATGVTILGFVDPGVSKQGVLICNLPVLGGDDALNKYDKNKVFLANGLGSIGTPDLRKQIQERFELSGWKFISVRHPSSIISPFAELASDVQIFAGSIVQPGAKVGKGCIINTAAIIEHDVKIEAWTHVAPRSLICGHVNVGECSHIGAGAVIRQGLFLGKRTVVGAGAVVINDFPGNGTLIGMPAQRREKIK